MTTHDATDMPTNNDADWLPCYDAGFDTLLDKYDERDFTALLDTFGAMAARYAHMQGFHQSQYTHSPEPTINVLSRFTKLMLMVTELAETAEALRKDSTEQAYHMSATIPDFTQEEEELADTLIRLLDYAGTYRLRLARATLAKMAYNRTREHMHGGKKV